MYRLMLSLNGSETLLMTGESKSELLRASQYIMRGYRIGIANTGKPPHLVKTHVRKVK